MADVGTALKIKYGLGHNPSPERAQEWARLTRELIRSGLDPDAAGAAAAKQLFRDFQTHVYASEGDTLEMLLQQAGGK